MLLNEEDRAHLIQEFSALTEPVKLVMFTQTLECQYCAETRQICEELAGLSDKIELEVYNFATDKERADELGINKTPAIAILRGGELPKDYGIRFYGIPSGYEFGTLVEDILIVSGGKTKLRAETRQQLKNLTTPSLIQVFVTPTCPYCPRAVSLAHQLAVESEHIRADMVEAIEFPHLSNKYGVMGVPRTVFNDTVHVEGAVPEPLFVQKLLESAANGKN